MLMRVANFVIYHPIFLLGLTILMVAQEPCDCATSPLC